MRTSSYPIWMERVRALVTCRKIAYVNTGGALGQIKNYLQKLCEVICYKFDPPPRSNSMKLYYKCNPWRLFDKHDEAHSSDVVPQSFRHGGYKCPRSEASMGTTRDGGPDGRHAPGRPCGQLAASDRAPRSAIARGARAAPPAAAPTPAPGPAPSTRMPPLRKAVKIVPHKSGVSVLPLNTEHCRYLYEILQKNRYVASLYIIFLV